MQSESLIAALLYEAEGAELDFKREQYLFSESDDRVKSELLKDILAFANAWRRTDAYILIGVQEVKEAESVVVGISSHIDDARLQQFVNSKTNRPVEFSYSPMSFQGKQIGVIHIPVQDRPIFLMKDYGALRRNTVYLRRGSSTDEARPDEVARMGQAQSASMKPLPLLKPRFAVGNDWSTLSETTTFETSYLSNLDIDGLPDYAQPQPTGPYGIPISISLGHTNCDFYRERAEFVRFNAKMRPVRFAVNNDGTAPASDVKLTTCIVDPMHALEVRLGSDQPTQPAREWSPIGGFSRHALGKTSPDIEVMKTADGWTITAYFGKIQAKDSKLTSETLYFGMDASNTIEFPTQLFADELSSPATSALTISFLVTNKEIPLDLLTR